jgi:hypothetical protein
MHPYEAVINKVQTNSINHALDIPGKGICQTSETMPVASRFPNGTGLSLSPHFRSKRHTLIFIVIIHRGTMMAMPGRSFRRR